MPKHSDDDDVKLPAFLESVIGTAEALANVSGKPRPRFSVDETTVVAPCTFCRDDTTTLVTAVRRGEPTAERCVRICQPCINQVAELADDE